MSKYLFVVQSSITQGMAQAIIEERKLASDDCVLLRLRGYQPTISGFSTLNIDPYTISPFRWKERKAFFKTCKENRRRRISLENLITEKIGEPFTIFIPHLWSYSFWLIIMHSLCSEYIFIEEGSLSYFKHLESLKPKASSLKQAVLQGLQNSCLGRKVPVFPDGFVADHPKYGGCYGSSKDSFPNLSFEKKHILTPVFRKREEYREIKNILITSPMVEFNYCTLQEYEHFITALFQFFVGRGISTLHVKLHPQQYFEGITIPVFRKIARKFEGKVRVIVLPRTASPEEIAFSSQADFYLGMSSVGYYSVQFGCRVYSYSGILSKHWPAFNKVYQQIPPAFTRKMIPLDFDYPKPTEKSE